MFKNEKVVCYCFARPEQVSGTLPDCAEGIENEVELNMLHGGKVIEGREILRKNLPRADAPNKKYAFAFRMLP